MHHDTPLISTIVAGLVLAYIFGMIAHRFRMPPLVGYLFAGVLVGPHTPGFIADQAVGAELAEIGVILLMFGVGLHFSLKDLMSVRSLAIPGAIAQIALATLLGLGLALLMGWGLGAGIIFGLALSVASTVVLLKALQDRRLIETERGRIAVGWLIVEDLAMVLALVLIPAFETLGGGDVVIHDPFVSFVERLLGNSVGIWGVLALTIIKLAAFVGFMLVVGRRAIPWALHLTAHTGSRELFRLAVLAIALGVALGSAVLFGVSLALGAFFAGMILSESELSHRAAQETLPLRDAFAVLFFVSVGMLFDPSILLTQPLPVLATVFIIMIGKSLAAFGIVLLFKRPVATALIISASLAQIGEFSFILASLGVSLAILPTEGQDLILAGALISIVLNPVAFWAVNLVRPALEARVAQRQAARMERDGVRIEPTEALATAGEASVPLAAGAGLEDDDLEQDDDRPEPTGQTNHTILVGFGRVGRVIGEGLRRAGTPVLVIEDADHAIAAARAAGIEVISGNAASAEVLRLANLPAARCLMIAIPNGYEAGSVCEVGRKLNPTIRILARAHSDEEAAHLRSFGANDVIMGEREIGLGMLAWVRGERGEGDADLATEPAASRLPPVDNIFQTAVATPIAATVPLVVEEPLPPAESAPLVTPDTTPSLEEELSGIQTLEPDDFDADLDVLMVEPAFAAEEIDPTASSDAFEEPPLGVPIEDNVDPSLSLATDPVVDEAPAVIEDIEVPVAPSNAPAQMVVDHTAIVTGEIASPLDSAVLEDDAVIEAPDAVPDPFEGSDGSAAPEVDTIANEADTEDAATVPEDDSRAEGEPEAARRVIPLVMPEPK